MQRQAARTGFREVDVFGTPISDSTTNVTDIASHYPYSGERWRIFVDGSRVFPEYNAVPQYNHAGPFHELIPGEGETVAFQTAERPRYVVSYELQSTFAYQVDRLLRAGDAFQAGIYDDTDGWYLRYDGSQSKSTVFLCTLEDGVEIVQQKVDVGTIGGRNPRSFLRYEITTGWYRVTSTLYRQTLTDDGETKNVILGETSIEPDGGPRVGNLPCRYEITRGVGNPPITLRAGSVAQKNLGTTTPFVRVKTFDQRQTLGPTEGIWEPYWVMRKDPNRKIVNLQITEFSIVEFTGGGDVQAILRAHDPSLVLNGAGNPIPDADFFTPIEMSAEGSIVEIATTVAEAPDGTGTPTTSVTPSSPPAGTGRIGGYQVGYASLYTSGLGVGIRSAASRLEQKRSLYDLDVAVVWIKFDAAADAGDDIVIEVTTEQDW